MDIIALRDEARKFLANHPDSADKLARRLDVPYWWLVKFRTGTIHNCSAERLQRVLDFMAAEKAAA